MPTGASGECRFADRVFHAEIAENTEGRQRLATLKLIGCEGKGARMELQQHNGELDGPNRILRNQSLKFGNRSL